MNDILTPAKLWSVEEIFVGLIENPDPVKIERFVKGEGYKGMVRTVSHSCSQTATKHKHNKQTNKEKQRQKSNKATQPISLF